MIIAVLLTYLLIREVVYQITLHRLVNKLMSRNYFDYETTQATAESRKQSSVKKQEQVEDPEDYATLEGIHPLI